MIFPGESRIEQVDAMLTTERTLIMIGATIGATVDSSYSYTYEFIVRSASYPIMRMSWRDISQQYSHDGASWSGFETSDGERRFST